MKSTVNPIDETIERTVNCEDKYKRPRDKPNATPLLLMSRQ